MSAADEAWQEWQRSEIGRSTFGPRQSFMAGYRRALEDAADEYEKEAEREDYGGELWSTTAAALRARAVAVAPRETKD